ncbi:MAG: hypothetical protein ABSD56_10515 [Bryobacteraceae bacterium]
MDNALRRRLRGLLLVLIYENHEQQRHRLDDLTLWGALDRLHFDIARNEIRTLLQDLAERDCIAFTEDRNLETGHTALRQIMLRPHGRDLVEKTVADAAIWME